jgi:AAA15 family ATPase/GTPase
MSELLLDSLEIKGYRCFEHLTIEKLGRVNLIVGKNNVGKTAFLEALLIYANDGRGVVESILSERDEDKDTRFYNKDKNIKPKHRHLFFNRLIANETSPNIQFTIGSVKDEKNFVAISSSYGEGRGEYYHREHAHRKEINNEFVEVKRLAQLDINALWDGIVNTQTKKKVFEALRILDPNIIEVNVQPFEHMNFNLNTVILAQVENQNEALPLKSFGEGLNRIFEIALTLVKCENGILLIDEIEIGLHYSVLPEIWKLIFKTAKDLNVQVFATTHSKDCIEAFSEAACDSPEDGKLIRLENNNGTTIAKVFNEENLETITRRDIEVR